MPSNPAELKRAADGTAKKSIPTLEASKNRGVSQTLGGQSLYMTGAVAACFDGYGDGHYSRTHRQHHTQNLELNLCYTLKKSLLCVRLLRHSMRAADVASTARRMSLGRWLLVACFLSVKSHNVSGPVSLHTTEKSLCQTLGRQSLYMTGAVAACFDGYGDGHYCKPYNYWRNGNVAVPGLFIYRRKAGEELFRVTVTAKIG